MQKYATASEIINTALQELGMGVVNIDAAALDATGWQMIGLLNSLGSEVLRANDWQHLEQVMTFVGDGVNDTFDLPTNFGRQVNQTEWSVSQNRPMQGPVSPQQWAWNKYGIVSAGMFFQYRILRGQYHVFPMPGLGQEFALYYITENWVVLNGNIFDGSATVVNSDDVILLDSRLMVAGLKLKFWTAKGLDTTALKSEFEYLLASEKAQSTGAPVISLTGSTVEPLIGWNNITDGNWNQ